MGAASSQNHCLGQDSSVLRDRASTPGLTTTLTTTSATTDDHEHTPSTADLGRLPATRAIATSEKRTLTG
jgi:hypothetical protein